MAEEKKQQNEAFARTALLVGPAAVNTLAQKRVAVFGVGGVGGYVCEALARAGVGALDLFDPDTVAESNLNRQIVALHSTLGQPKVEVMRHRIEDINPACRVVAHQVFYLPKNAAQYPLSAYDYVVDAVDTVSAKLELVVRAHAAAVPLISSMGTGNKLHPECFAVMPLEESRVCPLARIVRKELKKRGVPGPRVVCSAEPPQKRGERAEADGGDISAAISHNAAAIPPAGRRDVPGSISFVPGAAGLVLAGAVVRDLLRLDES